MKCRNCGCEVNSDLVFCPGCGAKLQSGPDMDEITVEIAGKVDLFMNEAEKKAEAGDGISMANGCMVTDEEKQSESTLTRTGFEDEAAPTITRKDLEAESDSVFSDISKALKEDDEQYTGYSDKVKEVPPSETGREYEPPREKKPEKEEKPKKKKTGLIAGIIIAAAAVIAVAVCLLFFSGVLDTEEETETEEEAEDSITVSVTDGAEYASPLEITIESGLGNRIYYTLDGSTPSVTSMVYSGTITLDDSYVDDTEGTQITLKVCTYTDNSMKSAELEVTFTLMYSDVEAPVISPSSGNYDTETYITITAESGAKIYYTTDGTTPTEESSLYTGRFEMSRGNTVVSAIAVKNGIASAVTTAVYNLDIPSNYTFSEAKDIVLEFLINRGLVNDTDGAADDGYVEFMDGGTCIIDNDQYIIVICDFYNEEDVNTETLIYGVDDQTGTYTKLTVTESGYTK